MVLGCTRRGQFDTLSFHRRIPPYHHQRIRLQLSTDTALHSHTLRMRLCVHGHDWLSL